MGGAGSTAGMRCFSPAAAASNTESGCALLYLRASASRTSHILFAADRGQRLKSAAAIAALIFVNWHNGIF